MMKKFSLFLMLVLLVSANYGVTLLVPGTYADIPAALSAANNGDIIQVTAGGSYVTAGTMNINKNVTIQGTVSGINIINQVTLQGTANVTVQNLTFTGAGNGFTTTDTTVNGNLTILNCFITGKSLWGLNISGPTNVTMTNSIISSNYAGANLSGGIYTFNGCSIVKAGSGSVGIALNGYSTLSMSNYYSTGNSYGLACQGTTGNTIVLSNCSFVKEGVIGVEILQPTNATLTNCTVSGNLWENILIGSSGTYTAPGCVVTLINCVVNSCRAGGGLICEGVQETVSIISTQLNNNDSYGFLYAYAPVTNTIPSVFNFSDSQFSGNTISGFGVVGNPLYVSAVTAVRCQFDNNVQSGITTSGMEGNCMTYISQCDFSGNGQNAIYLSTNDVVTGYSSVYIERSHFVDGSGNTYPQLVGLNNWSETTIVNSIFDSGVSQLWINGANVRVFNCDFVTNTNGTVNAINYQYSTPTGGVSINNCIFSGATTAIQTYNNTTVTINGLANIYQNIGTPYTGTAVNKGTLAYTVGNPQFITPSSGPGTGNFQLQNTSPCLFKGINYSFITNDYLGNPRPAIAGKNCDIGAYEDQTETPPPTSVPYSLWPLFE